MSQKKLQFILCIVLLISVPKCCAPPIQQDNDFLTSKLPITSILRTVLLGYLTHIVTIRPRTGITDIPTFYRRILALIWPCGGIGLATGSIYKSLFGDRILGIREYKPFFKSYEKGKIDKEDNKKENSDVETRDKGNDDENTNEADRISQTQVDSASVGLLTVPSISTSECEKDNKEAIKTSELNELHSEASKLRDQLVGYIKKESFLHLLGPKDAKKTKHCILNGSLVIGFNDSNKQKADRSTCKTETITVTGPGAACKYQRTVDFKDVCYMTVDMINQLETAYNMDDTSYLEIFITIGQLLFTTFECMDLDGDRWAKLIIIMYTIMSVLQTLSLLMLHKQISTFSIKEDEDEETLLNDDDSISTEDEDKKTLVNGKDSISTEDGRKHLAIYSDLVNERNFSITFILTVLVIFFLIGIWADYNSHSTFQISINLTTNLDFGNSLFTFLTFPNCALGGYCFLFQVNLFIPVKRLQVSHDYSWAF
ncbi:hypothetical protein PHYBLDRAFT_170081 [Phycomyces blakesleeanus NRRL 1555(-)]|uniref:Uncharacterized protein n=1 Tax=Phycomyces blakesleeanus (strain ATCC 8743b / DSM 1359 / FGSC 10004 / NBRC 33097 / NRRL 1555) TaxID=763407 RepID=A0A167M9A4_PHYB8|nr:hypothetical protein PHYBLDRAFT_170081 [Phycomyces blakesleeanus NRRL 1555(-)]OAD72184.1 hypothetical protein PHYBLDRAFT_170081 [Phycomyces blakesleeanus NRRL 1555(-)]|eukprot:XP_018290224.1 hypothetical protein PHYBLDRAFT_170081 [Phycomyces blakesleeanus NRRL 1555(-)]